jgi:hypothetical protein
MHDLFDSIHHFLIRNKFNFIINPWFFLHMFIICVDGCGDVWMDIWMDMVWGWTWVLPLGLWTQQSFISLVSAKCYFVYFRQVLWKFQGLKFGIFHAIDKYLRCLLQPLPAPSPQGSSQFWNVAIATSTAKGDGRLYSFKFVFKCGIRSKCYEALFRQ